MDSNQIDISQVFQPFSIRKKWNVSFCVRYIARILMLLMWLMHKESYPRVNEGKQESKQFIIYDLDSIARVNDNPKL